MTEKASAWLKKSPMHMARSHSAVASYKGRIYVFGGGSEGFKSLNSTEIYDPDRDIWLAGKDMPTTRSGAVAAVLNDRIYVIGGGLKQPDGRFEFFRTVEIYAPETDTWSRGPDMKMPHDYPASSVLDGRVYVLGGHHPAATDGGPMTDPGFSFCEVFDPEENWWQELTAMPTARFALASAVSGNRILAMGGAGLRENGFKNFDVIESYDPGTDTWDDAGFRLPWPAAGLAVSVVDEKLYIMGGNSGKTIENRFAYYDPVLNKWIELEGMAEGRIVMGATTIDSTIYLIGGRGPDKKTPLDTVIAYETG